MTSIASERRRAVRSLLVALVGLPVLLASCGSSILPALSPAPALTRSSVPATTPGSPSSSAPPEAPSPAVTIPPSRLPLTAIAEADGVRIRIDLDRNPMPVGQLTWLATTIVNTGAATVFWDADCDAAVWTNGVIAGSPWRPGSTQPEPMNTFKAYLLEHQGLGTTDRYVQFEPRSFVDGGDAACSEVGHIHSIEPGKSLKQRARWDGFAFDRMTPPATSPVDLVGRFTYGRTAEAMRTGTLEVHLQAWIAGTGVPLIDPGDAVDVALRDPRLTTILAARELRNGNEGLCRYDPESRLYEIGIVESGSLPVARVHMVRVDARSGTVVDFVERAWDYAVDGSP